MFFQKEEMQLEEEYKQKSTPKSKKNIYVYCWGNNQDGQLSLAHSKNTNLPKPSKGYQGYPSFISSAKQHTALVTIQGSLYVSGSTLHGKLGLQENYSNYVSKFVIIPHFRDLKVKQVACGDYHTMCLLQNGDVYAWGGTLHGKLGQKLGRPSQVVALAKYRIQFVDCGDFHSVALSQRGQLFSWGGGGPHKNKGQLGHGHQNDVQNPQIIQSLRKKPIKLVKCGGYHTMCVTVDEQIFAWGEGIYGQCGYGQCYDTPNPKKIQLSMNKQMIVQDYFMTYLCFIRDHYRQKTQIKQIALGGHHSIILTSKGHVFAFGYGSHGQLGLSTKTQNVAQPTLVMSLLRKKVIKIAVGWNHTIVLTQQHNVYVSGYGKKGQLGLGDQKIYINFTHVTALAGKNITQIYAGGDNSWAVVDQYQPEIQNYQFPSLLRIPQQFVSVKTNNLQANSKISKSISQISNNNNYLQDLFSNEKILQIIYTDVQLFHRFIRFSTKQQLKLAINKKIQQYFTYCYNIEKGITYHRFQNDSELYDSNNNLISSPDYKKSCTIMIICNPLKNIPAYLPTTNKENDWIQVNKHQKTTPVSIGEMLALKESTIIKNQKESIMSRWFLKFITMFDGICQKTRFIQMRPKNYQ